ncbi:MAG TPA: NAD(P)/FAD-dependent oxidoreductase [Vicinamibacterales bacterium]|nr:NAD(P)/FAD-dependent oxidoreductase [Vicinamibacterales bacterium]
MTTRPRVVIVGGGFGGLAAAGALARAPVDITLVDRRNHHVFSPLLYQVATAGLSPGDIASPIRWILRRQRNVRVWLAEVTAIDTARRTVTLADGTLEYDYLIVAAGSRPSYFGRESEWQLHAPGLKTMEDALAIRERVLVAFERAERERDPAVQRRLLTFVVVGGGATGVELAGALAEISRHALAHDFRSIHPDRARIILVEGGSDVLTMYPTHLSRFARRALERLGVAVWTGSPVSDIGPGWLRVGGTGGETIETDTVLWAAGVGASPLGATLGAPLDRQGRVRVRPDMTLPDRDDVYVVGDLATLPGDDGRPLPGVIQVALQQARLAAENIVHTMKGQPRRPFRYRDFGTMATIGRNAAVCDLGWLHLKGYLAWWIWLFLHVFKLIGFRNRLTVMTQWAFAYLTYQRSVRLITGDHPWQRSDRS